MRPLTPTYLIAVEDSEYKYDLLPDGLWILLGTVTANEISFDVEPYLRPHTTKHYFTVNEEYDPSKVEQTYWEYGGGIIKNVCHSGLSATESFYSLLKSNGLFFENPLGKNDDTGHNARDREWREAENTLVKKLLILKPI